MLDHGTLVVMIPTNEGLVAASDSRLTLDDVFCDGVEKFIEPARPGRTLLVVTAFCSTGRVWLHPEPTPNAN